MQLKILFLLIVSLIFIPCAHAGSTFVQHCNTNNSTFFPTTTAVCSITGVSSGNYYIIAGFSCTNTCEANGTQATHSMSDTLGLTFTKLSYVIFANANGLGNWAADSLWCAPITSNGNDTITLTLNASSGNGIEVEEWSGLSSCNAIGTPTPGGCIVTNGCSVVQSIFAGGGSSPHTFNGGSISINGGVNNSSVLGANGAANSSYLVQFAIFPVITGQPLAIIYGDCDNCGDLFSNPPAGYTVRGQGIGDNDSVLLSGNAIVGNTKYKSYLF